MKLVWRRAVEARGLLLASAVAALVAVALVTGLSDYNRRAVAAGQRALLQAAPAEERSLLVSGSGGADSTAYADRDRAVRAQFSDGLGGVPVTLAAARYGTGRELTGDLGSARVGDDPLFADLATLDDLAGHAELTAGAWPTPGATPLQVTLPEKIAGRSGCAPATGCRCSTAAPSGPARWCSPAPGDPATRPRRTGGWPRASATAGRARSPRTARSRSTRPTSPAPSPAPARRPGWSRRISPWSSRAG
ncbi:hypothetical protein [Micromonospora sp. ATA51]|uniref:hypothetical protein n=1 Tax=Micromonospora sp. ATA51 TaxID=2806098 RepID=UPI001EE4065A|nr:hypothetical protein [Micromonospora sp. ATA51]